MSLAFAGQFPPNRQPDHNPKFIHAGSVAEKNLTKLYLVHQIKPSAASVLWGWVPGESLWGFPWREANAPFWQVQPGQFSLTDLFPEPKGFTFASCFLGGKAVFGGASIVKRGVRVWGTPTLTSAAEPHNAHGRTRSHPAIEHFARRPLLRGLRRRVTPIRAGSDWCLGSARVRFLSVEWP